MYLEQLEGQRGDLAVVFECVTRVSNVNPLLLPPIGRGSLAAVSFVCKTMVESVKLHFTGTSALHKKSSFNKINFYRSPARPASDGSWVVKKQLNNERSSNKKKIKVETSSTSSSVSLKRKQSTNCLFTALPVTEICHTKLSYTIQLSSNLFPS